MEERIADKADSRPDGKGQRIEPDPPRFRRGIIPDEGQRELRRLEEARLIRRKAVGRRWE
jgi:hypothetical protein